MQWGRYCRYAGVFFGNGLWLICGLEAEERKTISRNLEFKKAIKKKNRINTNEYTINTTRNSKFALLKKKKQYYEVRNSSLKTKRSRSELLFYFTTFSLFFLYLHLFSSYLVYTKKYLLSKIRKWKEKETVVCYDYLTKHLCT